MFGAYPAFVACATEPVSRLGPSGFDPSRIDRMAKVLRDLAADERSMSEAIRLPEYKCEWLDEAATLLEAIAMEARQGGDAEERLHAKHDSAAIAQRGSE